MCIYISTEYWPEHSLKENFYYAQNAGNGSNVGSGGPLLLDTRS